MPVRISGLSPRLKQWGMVSLVFGLVLLCYWPALRGAILWDDPAHIPRPELQSWAGLWQIWFTPGATQQYYPILFSAFWVEHQLWGDSTLGYHLVNVFLHATSACLFALILRRLWAAQDSTSIPSVSTARKVPAGAEWIAALVFAVHPICVESVAWITEQKNTLSLFFYLLAALVYLDFSTHRRRGMYVAATLLFFLALASKTATVTLPAALLVVLWWKQGRLQWQRDVRPLLPWFLAATAMGLFTSWVERKLIGAEGSDFELALMDRTLLAGRAVWFYVGKLVWPVELNFFYPRWDVAVNATAWIGYFFAAIAVTLVGWRLRRRARGPLAGWLLFAGTLFPILGFFKVFFFIFSYVNDHFLYLASLGFIASVVGGAALGFARGPTWLRPVRGGLAFAVVAILAVLSQRQSALYRDNITLFRATIAKNPESWMGHHILGFALAKLPDGHREALIQFREAVRLNPRYPDAHLYLAIELAKTPGGQNEAIAEYEMALQLRPQYVEAHNNLAVELARIPGRLPEALAHFETAIRLKPNFADARTNFANALMKLPERRVDALTQYEAALRLKPDSPQAHYHFAFALAGFPERTSEAIVHFEEALRLKPDYAEAHHDLANRLATIPGRAAEAVAHYEAALRLDPQLAAAHFNLANILVHLPGRRADALQHYEATLAIKPDFADAHGNLANALTGIRGRESEVLAHYEEALRISPNLIEVHYNLSLYLSHIPGREADAVSHGEEALRLNPEYVEGHNGLALVYAQQGRFAPAKLHWERALQLDPHNETARQNLVLLERLQKK